TKVAFSVADVCVSAVAGFVSTVGGLGSVVNGASAPVLVPPAFFATTRKWYPVFALSPPTDAVTETGLVPAPGEGEHGTLDPYVLVLPYSSLHSASPPLGSMAALRV